MSDRVFIGIDPGAYGAVAVCVAGKWCVFDCPTNIIVKMKTRKKLTPKQIENGVSKTYKSESHRCDPVGMAHLLKQWDGGNTHVFMEKVGAAPGQGVTSMFTFGEGFGVWKGVIAALGMPHTLVTPQAWKKEMLAGMTKEKGSSIARAKQLFPYLAGQLTKLAHDGRAEALLIGEYGRSKQRYLKSF